MRNPLLPSLILAVLAAALYFLPDSALYGWRLAVRGAVARLHKPQDPRADAMGQVFSDSRDLLHTLQQKDAELADLRRQLRDLGVTREAVPGRRIVAARIMRLGPDNTLDTFTIDTGSRDGVAAGQAVVVGQTIVGVVVRAEADAALVLALSSPACYLSARLGEADGEPDRPRILGAVRGSGGGGVVAVVFSTATSAREGWLALTSGLEPSIPAGLVIGTLEGRLNEGEEGGTLDGALRPAADLAALDFVAVVAED